MGVRPLIAAMLFLVGLLAVDRFAAVLLAQGFSRVDTGQASGLTNRALDHAQVDALVFGSSRAVRHVNPEVLEPVVGEVYNAGLQGQGILYARMLQALLLERGTGARLFLLQIDLPDFYVDDVNRVLVMAPFYGRNSTVDAILEQASRFAWLKLQSHAYRYNSMALPILRNLLAPAPAAEDGFTPLRGSLEGRPPQPPERLWSGVRAERRMALKEEALRSFLHGARSAGIDVVAFTGPRYRQEPLPAIERRTLVWVRDAVAAGGGLFLEIDQSSHPVFRNPALYHDPAHLNGEGAQRFSALVAEQLDALSAAVQPARASQPGRAEPPRFARPGSPPPGR